MGSNVGCVTRVCWPFRGLYFHVIPRYTGDVPDPRGGIRHVIPGKPAYWGEGGKGKAENKKLKC